MDIPLTDHRFLEVPIVTARPDSDGHQLILVRVKECIKFVLERSAQIDGKVASDGDSSGAEDNIKAFGQGSRAKHQARKQGKKKAKASWRAHISESDNNDRLALSAYDRPVHPLPNRPQVSRKRPRPADFEPADDSHHPTLRSADVGAHPHAHPAEPCFAGQELYPRHAHYHPPCSQLVRP